MDICKQCGKKLNRWAKKYCSNKCQRDFQHDECIKLWKDGKELVTKNISKSIKRYLIEKYQDKCILCGWQKKNKFTGRVPLEIDHKDGNANNNKASNLRLVCPNCHSLTENFRNLNRGNGRKWRNKKNMPV